GTILVTHTAETRADLNMGTRALPVSRYDFRLKLLTTAPNGYQMAGAPLTPGIRKTLWFWDPDVRVDYTNVAMWELDPVEVRARAVPPAPGETLDPPAASVLADDGV